VNAVTVVFVVLWFLALAYFWRRIDAPCPAVALVQNDLEFLAVLAGGALTLTLLILGRNWL
jgi:hypothetical protein